MVIITIARKNRGPVNANRKNKHVNQLTIHIKTKKPQHNKTIKNINENVNDNLRRNNTNTKTKTKKDNTQYKNNTTNNYLKHTIEIDINKMGRPDFIDSILSISKT